MAETYWEARARLLAERDAPEEIVTAEPVKRVSKTRAEVEPQPAAEPPGDPGLTTKE